MFKVICCTISSSVCNFTDCLINNLQGHFINKEAKDQINLAHFHVSKKNMLTEKKL